MVRSWKRSEQVHFTVLSAPRLSWWQEAADGHCVRCQQLVGTSDLHDLLMTGHHRASVHPGLLPGSRVMQRSQVLGAMGTCISSEGKSEHSWIQLVFLVVPCFRLSRGTWLYQASVWPMVRSHCVLPERQLCLAAGEGEMLPLVSAPSLHTPQGCSGGQSGSALATEFSERRESIWRKAELGLSSGCLLSQREAVASGFPALWHQAQ